MIAGICRRKSRRRERTSGGPGDVSIQEREEGGGSVWKGFLAEGKAGEDGFGWVVGEPTLTPGEAIAVAGKGWMLCKGDEGGWSPG